MSLSFMGTRFILRDVRFRDVHSGTITIVFDGDDLAAICQMEEFLQSSAKTVFGTSDVSSKIYGCSEGYVLEAEISPSIVVTKTNCYAQGLKSNVMKMLKSRTTVVKSAELEGGIIFQDGACSVKYLLKAVFLEDIPQDGNENDDK